MEQFNQNLNGQQNGEQPVNGQPNHPQNQQGMNQQGMYQQGMDQQGMYQQGINPQGMNQQGMNQQGMNQQGMNQQGMNQQGMYQQGMNQQGMNPQGMNQQGMYQQGMNQQGMNQQGINQQGINQQGMNQQGMNQSAMWQNNIPQYEMYQSKPRFRLFQMDDMQQALLNQDVMYREAIPPKKLLSRAGIALAILAAVVLGVQTIIEALVMSFQPEFADSNWYVWVVTAVSLVLIGFPVYFLLMKRIPDTPRGEVTKLKPFKFISFFFISVAAMYITNFFSTILTMMIALIKGEELINPASEAILNGNFLVTLVYAAIVAPIIEELIFRKLLLDKLRRFGELPAILLTGLAFGLFHLNLMQFFYATVLGFIFAYITIRTNTVIYSILLHMMINFLSTAISPLVADMNIYVMIGIISWEFLSIAAGITLFIFNMKNIRIIKTTPVLKVSEYFANAGTILYSAICLVVIVIMTVL